MVTAVQNEQTRLSDAVETWARECVWFDEATIVTHRPWAKTWRLAGQSEDFFLKEIPACQRLTMEAMPGLHRQFPDVVPKVLGVDRSKGLILLADHGGQTPHSGMPESLRVRLLETYARLQAEAATCPELLAALPTIDVGETLNAFFDYLRPGRAPASPLIVGTDYFLGTADAQAFHDRIAPHRDRLSRLLEHCDELPVTINHGDLRRSNMAIADDGRCLIFDWDESIVGPAGLSLHNFFRGCRRASSILAETDGGFDNANSGSRKVRRMQAYVECLVSGGYSDRESLRRALPATVCLGVLRYLTSYSVFPQDDAKYCRVVREIHEDRLTDLAELCEWLASRAKAVPTSVKPVASEARASHSPRDDSQREDVQALEEYAARPKTMPTLRFNDAELAAQEMSRDKLKLGSRLFKRYGTLLIENAFDPGLVDELAEDYFANYDRYSEHKRHEDALKVGSRRYMVTIELAGAFNSPAVYAPPLVLPVIRRILGDDMILGSITAVASLGGSKDMHIHKDHPALFPRREVSHELPSFGVSMILPLLGFSEELGTTRVWKGSHKTSLKESLKTPFQDPYASKGSVLLMDYRLTHQGLANRTDQVRPILDVIYQRPWFRDIANYGQQPAMTIPDGGWEQIPEEDRCLFEWIGQHG